MVPSCVPIKRLPSEPTDKELIPFRDTLMLSTLPPGCTVNIFSIFSPCAFSVTSTPDHIWPRSTALYVGTLLFQSALFPTI
ncbi:MAG: hypothetical protein ACREBI_04255 [Nitrosotalea sp.]